MSEQVGIDIRVNDAGATATFQRLGSAASTMAGNLSRAGTSGASGLRSLDSAATQAGSALGRLDSAADRGGQALGRIDDGAESAARGLGRIDDEASRAGAALGRLDDDAARADSALDRLDDGAGRLSAGLGKVDAAGAVLGGALSGVLGIASDATRAFEEAEASSRRLAAAFDAAGVDIADYEQALSDAGQAAVQLGIDDEAALDAIGRMVTISGDAEGAIANLGLVMDIAAARGIDLESAANAVGRAMSGNYTQLERMGVVVGENATATEVLAEAQRVFAGQAEASSTVMDRFAVAAGNAQEELGAMLEPFSGILSILPGLSSGFTLVGSATGAAVTGVGKLTAAAKASETAMSLLGVATGPVGIGLAALVGTSALVYAAFERQEEITRRNEEALIDLEAAMVRVGDAEIDAAFQDAIVTQEEYARITGNVIAGLDGLKLSAEEYNRVNEETAETARLAGDEVSKLGGRLSEWASFAETGVLTGEQWVSMLEDQNTILAHMGPGAEEARANLDGIAKALSAGTITGAQAAVAIDATANSLAVFDARAEVAAESAAEVGTAVSQSLEEIAAAAPQTDRWSATIAANEEAHRLQGQAILDSAEAARREREEAALAAEIHSQEANAARLNAQALQALGDEAGLTASEMDRAAEIFAAGGTTISGAIAQAAGESAAARNELRDLGSEAGLTGSQMAEASRLMAEEGLSAADAVAQVQQRADALADSLRSALIPGIDGASESFQALARPGEDVLDVLDRLGSSTELVDANLAALADGLNDTAQALDGVLGTFDQIDQLGQRSQDAADIATSIVGDPGVYATVDDLLARGAITLQEYNRLQAQQIGISNDNVRVQDALNEIRANQIDDLAIAQAQYADYIVRLSQASEAEQAHALAMLDSGNQAKVAAAYSAAYAAQLGEIPPEVASEIIANAALADPVIAGLLEDFGLISRGANGEITVNLPDASQAAIDQFEALFGEGNVTRQADGMIHVENDDGTEAVYTQFGEFVGTVEKGAHGEASVSDDGSIGETKAEIDALDGRQVLIDVAANIGQGLADLLSGAADFLQAKSRSIAVDVEVDESELTALYARLGESADRTVIVDIQGNAATFDATLADLGAGAAPVIVDVQANRAAFDGALADLGRDSQPVIVDIQGNRSAFDGTLDDARAAGEEFADSNFIAELSGNREAFDGTVADATGAGQTFDAQNFIAELSANAEAWAGTLAAAQGEGATFDATNYIAELSANAAAFDGTLASARSAGGAFDTSTFTADLAANDGPLQDTISRWNGRTVGTIYMEVDATDSDGDTQARHGRILRGYQHGGFLPDELPRLADGGRVPVWVGEAGPELALMPAGTQVFPTVPSRHRAQEFGRGGDVHIHSPITLYPAGPDAYDALRQAFLSQGG